MRRIGTSHWARVAPAPADALGAGALAAAALALSAWEGTLVQRSAAAHWSLLAVIAAALAAAAVAGRRRQRETSADWFWRRTGGAVRDVVGAGQEAPGAAVLGAAIWVVLVAATIGWDLNSFVHQAHDLPTLSRLVGSVTHHDWGRALLFSLWLALGAYLTVGGRRRLAGATQRSRGRVPGAAGAPDAAGAAGEASAG